MSNPVFEGTAQEPERAAPQIKGAMMRPARNISIILTTFLFSLSWGVAAADCQNDWWRPAFQAMKQDAGIYAGISYALTDYQNEESHFSAKQDPDKSFDVYYLKDVLLIKGYSEAQIVETGQSVLSMMPIATMSLATGILARAAPKGPCYVGAKTPFFLSFSGKDRLRDRTLSSASGHLLQSAPNEISYEFEISIDPPLQGKASIRHSGTMSFAPQEKSPPGDADVTGYTVFPHSRPLPVIGSPAIPVVKLDEVRRFLAPKTMAPR